MTNLNEEELPFGYRAGGWRGRTALAGIGLNDLRRRGFQRQRGKYVFARHSLGVGGVYVNLNKSGFHVTCRDLDLERQCESSAELRELLDHIDALDVARATVFRQKSIVEKKANDDGKEA